MRKHLRNHSEVAHIFASRSQDEGHGCNMSFNDGALYSYRTAIMRFCEHDGKEFLLVNETGYSNSTSKHMCHARRATSHIQPKFYIGNLRRCDDLRHHNIAEMLWNYAMNEAADALQKSKRARANKAVYLGSAQHWMGEAQRVSDFFGLGKSIDREALDKIVADKEAAAKENAEAMREAQKRREEREAKELEELRERLEEWARCEQPLFYGFNRLPCRLRIAPTATTLKEIETSHGARIPYEDGRRAFQFVMRMRERGWRANGETFQIGAYQLNAVNSEGIVAGCHRISWDAILELANKEGWQIPQSTES